MLQSAAIVHKKPNLNHKNCWTPWTSINGTTNIDLVVMAEAQQCFLYSKSATLI